jgi:hypothetical protein
MRCRDWDPVRLPCTVIGTFQPGLVAVRAERVHYEIDLGLAHWDEVLFQVDRLNGAELFLRRAFLPAHMHAPNTRFWLNVGNDGQYRVYDRENAPDWVAIGSRAEAGV